MARNLTKKENGFVKDYIETGNGVQSALKNYDTTDYKTASNIASTNLDKPRIQFAIQEALPDTLLAEVHLEGLSATKDSEPDYAVRHKYLDSAYKIKGTYAPEKSITANVILDITPEKLELAKRYEEELKKGL